jgi:protein-disulfide isomerase
MNTTPEAIKTANTKPVPSKWNLTPLQRIIIALMACVMLYAGITLLIAMFRVSSSQIDGKKLTVVYRDGLIHPQKVLFKVATPLKKTIDVYSDFGCPNCADSHANIASKLEQLKNLGYAINYNYLVSRTHPAAYFATEYRRCLTSADTDFDGFVLTNQAKWSGFQNQNQFDQFAREAGYAVTPGCIGQKTREQYRADLEIVLATGVNGTPTYEINGWRAVGVLSKPALEAIVNSSFVNTDIGCAPAKDTCNIK